MERVDGIGGVFFKARDPELLTRWYAEMLGVDPPPSSYQVSPWQQQAGPTVFAAMPAHSEHLGEQTWSINFRVSNLDAMVDQLRRTDVAVEVDPVAYPNGRFASLRDPEGNGIQLWEPAAP